MACEFELKTANKGFAILLQGGFSPIFYTTEWQKETDYLDVFNWW